MNFVIVYSGVTTTTIMTEEHFHDPAVDPGPWPQTTTDLTFITGALSYLECHINELLHVVFQV